MPSIPRALTLAAAAAVLAAVAAGGAHAQQAAKGRIVCWKDKAGKVVGCGDRVPPEFEDSATKELDKRGVTRKTTDSAEEEAKRTAEASKTAKEKEEALKKQEEEKRRAMMARRQEAALLASFSNENEIDLKRDRDLDVVDRTITQLQALRKNAADRADDLNGRIQESEKAKRPVTDFLRDEAARAEADRDRLDQGIAGKEREKVAIRQRYADMKKRYNELQGNAPAAAAAAPAPSAKK